MSHAHFLVVESMKKGHGVSLRSSNINGNNDGHVSNEIRAAGWGPGQKLVMITLEDAQKLPILRCSPQRGG